MAVADAIEQLAWLADNLDLVQAGKRSLWSASEQARNAIAKQAGCSGSQVSMWSRGAWSPPTQQRLALMRAVAEYAGASLPGRVPA